MEVACQNHFQKEDTRGVGNKVPVLCLCTESFHLCQRLFGPKPKSVIGKVFSPFANEEVFVLALENNEQESETNEALLTELREHFYVTDKGAFTLGQDPTEQLRKLGYTKGAETSTKKMDLMLLSTIQAKVNPNSSALKKGTATAFISGHTPNKAIDLQRLKYFAPIINHEVVGAYEIVSVGVTYVDDPKHPMRLRFKLKNYRKFRKVFNYGVNIAASKGLALSPTQLAKYLEETTPQNSFSFAFENNNNISRNHN